MIRELNWSGILFGSGAGLITGLALYAVAGAVNGGTIVQVLIQFTAFQAAFNCSIHNLLNATPTQTKQHPGSFDTTGRLQDLDGVQLVAADAPVEHLLEALGHVPVPALLAQHHRDRKRPALLADHQAARGACVAHHVQAAVGEQARRGVGEEVEDVDLVLRVRPRHAAGGGEMDLVVDGETYAVSQVDRRRGIEISSQPGLRIAEAFTLLGVENQSRGLWRSLRGWPGGLVVA